jgi:SAM-dependent methyltransferase
MPRILFDGCPLCGSEELSVLLVADCTGHPLYHPSVEPMITWMSCEACKHVFTDGLFQDEVLSLVFSKTNPNQVPGANFESQRPISAKMVAKVAAYSPTGGTWLDVGFGNGSLLFTAEEWGYRPVGLDLRPSSAEAMQKLGIEAHCADLTLFESDAPVQVISMADVLEHMPAPIAGLHAAHRLLEPGGILFLSMPNYGCRAWKLLDEAGSNPYWAELEHYHNFSRERLYQLLDDAGFEPLNYGISDRYRICMEVIARRRA